MSNGYALVLTGKVLPGCTPASVWPQLAAEFGKEPEQIEQLLARAPQIIRQDDAPDKLKDLQARIARVGAQAELYPPDERPAMFVLPTPGGMPCGPVPDALVRQYLARGVWTAKSIRVAPAGSATWMPYHELDKAPAPPPVPPRPSSAFSPAMTATRGPPVTPFLPSGAARDEVCEDVREEAALLDALPAGKTIHAGFWRRCAALVLDGFIILIPLIMLSLLLIMPSFVPFQDGGGILAFIGQWLYFALMESSSWQATLGKRAMGIQVADEYGRRIGFGRATKRYFGKFLSGILYIGFMMAGWTQRKQALHDMMAGTFVVFNAVQPGCPLPTARPPMPWYGWMLNLAPAAFILLAAIALPQYQDYVFHTRVAEAIGATDTIRSEIVRQGCLSGSRGSPHPWIGTVEVRDDDEAQSCAITLTLGDGTDIPTFARGKFIELERNDQGNWLCSSSLPARYLPPNCR